MIIMLGHEKGGVGKSTFAITLAYHMAQNPDNDVVLVDTDESRNSTSWAALRADMGLTVPFTVVTAATDTTNNIVKLHSKFNAVIVDVGAGDYARLVDLGRVVDLWIAPTRTGQKDADSNVNLIEAVRQNNFRHRNGKIPLCFAFNQTPSSSTSTSALKAAEAIREYAPELKVLNTPVCMRSIFETADKNGKTIFEMPPSQRARAEADFLAMASEAFAAIEEFSKEVQ